MWKVITLAVALCALFITIQAQIGGDFCIQCTSSPVHPECVNPEPSDFNSRCPATLNNSRSCFSRVDEGGHVIRGCLNQLDNETAAECDSETCQICMGTDVPEANQGCNSGLFPVGRLRCIICAGGVNSTCAGVVNITMTVCPIYDREDRCYIARPNGNFERGCLSSATARCGEGESCRICTGEGCNFVDFNSAINIHSGAKVIAFALLSVALTLLNK